MNEQALVQIEEKDYLAGEGTRGGIGCLALWYGCTLPALIARAGALCYHGGSVITCNL